MPEGHTVHRLARRHTKLLRGKAVRVTSPQGRFADAALVDGQVLRGAEAWGKHLFHAYDNGLFVHVHLGIYGEFHEREPGFVPKDTTRMRIATDVLTIDLIGPTACEVVDDAGRVEIVARVGPDPLRKDADPEVAWERLRRRKGPIGPALLDQKLFAGVGNVFRAEALFVHGIHPETLIPEVTRDQFDALWATLRRMLEVGVKEGRIMTVDETELGLRRRDLNR
ncbi:MAG TPA: DNA-formamidopyrimidine glycosylase family protein, partial [Acidimicrobiales bacterium]|nr:DNA-formamidopyrimidine glycosylase family protein [Acidimicrobiales bacterium]